MLTTTRINFTTRLILPPSTLGSTTAFDINTVIQAHSFSFPPTTIAKGTEEDLSAVEKTTKLKQQWMNLLP